MVTYYSRDFFFHGERPFPNMIGTDKWQAVYLASEVEAERVKDKEEIERLKRIANEILDCIARGRLGSVGSIDNVYLPMIDVEYVGVTRKTLAGKEGE